MKVGVLDIILGLVIVALIGLLIYAVSTRVPEPFTELYFENHTTLPEYSSDADFVFSVNNLENKDMTYDVFVRGESAAENVSITSFSVDIPSGEKKSFRAEYSLPEGFGTGRVIVELANKNQSIHFWTTYARDVISYFGKLKPADCVPMLVTDDPIIMKVNATHGANVVLLLDGRVLMNMTLNSTKYINISQKGFLDVWFTNDYSNQTLGIDRNVVVNYVKADGLYYERFLVDEGSGLSAFDCLRTREGNRLSSNGAIRLKIATSR
jgi:hypothetical protein